MEQLDLLSQEAEGIKTITTREGEVVDVSGDKWHLPYAYYSNASIDFDKIKNQPIKEALKHYISNSLRLTSAHSGLSNFRVVNSEIMKFFDYQVAESESNERVLIDAFEIAISTARKEHRLWALYRAIEWYKWSFKNYPEFGFSEQYAKQLSTMSIPGNPKGQAVRVEDIRKGALNSSLELPLIIDSLKKDKSDSFKHTQERAAIALSIAIGRNPANLTQLRESDLSKLNPFDQEDPCYVLKVPRIKKRQLNPRDDFIEEYLDPFYGRIIEDLIAANKSVELVYENKKYIKPSERPVFINISGNEVARRSRSVDEVFNMTSSDISRLLRSFVSRHNIISPLTGSLLGVSARRFRYTLATGLASEGISRLELAKILDHTNTHTLEAYYDTRSHIVAHLDKASASQFSMYVSLFKGQVISNDDEAINGDIDEKHLLFIDEQFPEEQTDIGVCGELGICHLDPPFSCYLCPKFQPYSSADHEHVLDSLLEGREKRLEKYDNARLGIQLDDVILAVSNVIKLCKEA